MIELSQEAEKFVYYREYDPDIVIMLGDCQKIMPLLPRVDLCVTDPPYGIGASSKKFINGTSKTQKNYYEDNCWDTSIPSEKCFEEMFKISKDQIIWGMNYFIKHLKPCRCFLVWDKTIHGNSYADCELAWTSFDSVARIKAINMVECNMDGRVHPTQKPLRLMKWAIYQTKYFDIALTILDPFMGSGTTLVAAKEMKKDCIGIEINEKYCEIAVKRLKNTIVPFL